MKLHLIIGKAGTGKTYDLVNRTKKYKHDEYVILCPTHMSCINIKSRGVFNAFTIYSYFRINYMNGDFLPIERCAPVIFIDECGLVDIHLFAKLFRMLKQFDTDLWIYGDPLQLNPIYTTPFSIYDMSDIESIKYSLLKVLLPHTNNIDVIRHLGQGILSLFLGKNAPFKLASLEVFKNVYRQQGALYDELYDVVLKKKYTVTPLVEFVPKFDQYFLASTYDTLQIAYNRFEDDDEGIYVKNINDFTFTIKQHDKLIWIGESLKSQIPNGSVLEVEEISPDGIKIIHPKTLLTEDQYKYTQPLKYMVIHRSQGLTLPHVCIIVDKLFEPSLMYTALTRASKSFRLVSIDWKKEEFEKSLNTLKFIHDLIYG